MGRKSFTMLPNTVFVDYGLDNNHIAYYAWLKMLCGEGGTCYRSMRTISAMTQFSTGQLSIMTHKLHEIGLIHATKHKRVDKGGKEHGWPIWHISIVDIWQKNADYFSNGTEDEKSRETAEQQMETIAESVHGMNRTVHMVNGICPNCSHSETNKDSSNKDSNNKKKNTTQLPSGNRSSVFSSSFVPEKGTNQSPPQEKKPRGRQLSPVEHEVADAFDALMVCPINREDSAVKKSLKYLAGCITSGKATIADVKRVKDKLEENPFWQGKVTIQALEKLFSTTLTSLAICSPQDKPESEMSEEEQMLDWIRSQASVSGPTEGVVA